jgi:flavin reductase (DIM6/NTAB) family NADH-FMN oxidoreductase RutF
MNEDFSSSELRRGLGSFATGVTVITSIGQNGQNIGMTVNSFNAVSLDPPLVLWSVGCESRFFADFMASEKFAVHVLAADQEDISRKFSGPETDRFEMVPVLKGIYSLPILDHYRACFQCAVTEKYPAGDHVIIVGRVIAIDNCKNTPLVFYDGGYGI